MSETHVAAKTSWVMPDWMEPYRDLFNNTGGNSVEYLIDSFGNPNLAFTNLPLYTLACMAHAQVGMLTSLHRDGLLKEPK